MSLIITSKIIKPQNNFFKKKEKIFILESHKHTAAISFKVSV